MTKFSKFVENMDQGKNIAYTAIVLEEKNSRTQLLSSILPIIYKMKPEAEQWELIAHHMTINMGAFDSSLNSATLLGKDVEMKVTHVGVSERAIAVAVDAQGVASQNKIPHITILVNRAGGGKPFHSNQIESWTPLSSLNSSIITIKGKVSEVSR